MSPVAGTGIGPSRVPHLVEVQGRRLTIELEPHVAIFRYEDLPGMIGRVGTVFGQHGVNISSAAVGHGGGEDDPLAAMVVTSDAPVSREALERDPLQRGLRRGLGSRARLNTRALTRC